MYEGKPVGTPDAGAYWRVAAEHGVKVLFTAPTALRAIKQQDPEAALLARHDLSQLDALYLAGERCDPPTARWIAEKLGRPVVDHWWQTETGWPITAGFREYGLFPFKPGSGGRAGARLRRAGARRRRRDSAARQRRQPRHPPADAARRARPTLLAGRRRATAAPISPTSPAGTAPAMPARSTRTATSG